MISEDLVNLRVETAQNRIQLRLLSLLAALAIEGMHLQASL